MLGAPNPWAEDTWNLTEQGAYLTRYGLLMAEARARDAGTVLGGARPGKPKAPLQIMVQRRTTKVGSVSASGTSGSGPPV